MPPWPTMATFWPRMLAHALAGVEDGAGGLAHDPFGEVAVVGEGNHAVGAGGDVFDEAVAGVVAGDDNDTLALVELVAAAFDDGAGALVAGSAEAGGVVLFREEAGRIRSVCRCRRRTSSPA